MADVAILVCTLIFDFFILAYYMLSHKVQKTHERVFLLLFASIVVSTGCSLVSTYFEHQQNIGTGVFHLMYFSNMLYFLSHNLMAFLYAIYVMIVDGRGLGKEKYKKILFVIPLIIAEVLILLTPFFDLVFYYDENRHFFRGKFEAALYIIAVMYIALAIYYMIRYRKALSFRNNMVLWLFFIAGVIGVLIQLLNKEMKVEMFAESVALLGVIFTLENESELIDPSTKVYNRRAFFNDNRKFLETRSEYAVITMSVTNFRFYSKILSYGVMTAILDNVISWLNHLSTSLIIYRISTTKFALICLYDERSEVDSIVDSIKNRFEDGWNFGSVSVEYNVVLGVVFVPSEMNTEEKILTFAHENLEATSDNVFRGEDLDILKRRDKVEIALRKAIDDKSFKVYYQPIWSVKDERIHTAEALVRLIDDELGFIPPDEFIELAENLGLISQLGCIVFEEVCRFLSQEGKALNLEYVEINLSLYQLLDSNIDKVFSSIMKKYGINASQINLELTETVSPDLSKLVEENVDKLKSIGIKFSLDDFGTGYSNLNYLVSMNFTNMKIDKSLLWDAVKTESSMVIIKDCSKMMRKLGMNVIQEGVEDKEQLDLAIEAGATYIQGYYFSKPLPGDEFITYIESVNK